MEENKVTLSTRAFVRIISFLTAIAVALGISAAINAYQSANAKTQLQYGYMRAMQDLSLSMDNIKTTLNKGLYTNSPAMMSELSSKLWSEASTAKVALAQLPVEELNLEATYKFLSQVGNYSKSLAEKYSEGNELTGDEKSNLKTLYGYAQTLSDSMWSVENKIESGEMTFEKVNSAAGDTNNSGISSVSITEGFTDFEEGFSGYPTLIYDGPFSDHIMEKNPLMLEGKAEVSEEKAAEKAARVSGESDLTATNEEDGKMPSYAFANDSTTVSITKKGGYFCYMMKYRDVGEKAITVENAITSAKNYMEKLGIENVTDTYYEITNGVCIINFAGTQDDITLYTDLVKVGVALDNGDIISFDARGYITNHTERTLDEPKISKEEALQKLNDSLNIKESNLAVIPSDSMEERYCYEFSCTDSDGRQVLVYINADTGEEENILLLNIGSNGRLTV